MSLTGQFFCWLVTAAAVVAFVALVWAWPALGARRPRAVVVRAVALLGVNVLVLLTAAVRLNDQYLFYAGWADLRGAVGGTPASSRLHGGGSPLAAAQVRVDGSAPAQALLPLPAGSQLEPGVTAYTVTGPASHVTGQILVTLPPGYRVPVTGRPVTRYPVIETFSGYPGSDSQWVRTMRLRSVLATEVAAHRVGETIVVSPQIEVPAGVDTECVNGSPGNPQLETWLAQDVPEWVTEHFAVRPDRGSWATMGLSTGGWCAAMVAMLHPARFGGSVVLGGYFSPSFAPTYDPYPANSPLARRYDLVALARRSPPPVALWLETSHADPVSYGTSTALLKAAHAPLSVTATVLQNAGHRIDIWRQLLPTTLTWLGTDLPGFHP